MTKNSLIRSVLFASGCVFCAVGIIGIAVPMLPTTPFLILAVACFTRSSERAHSLLLNHKVFGPYLKEWHEHRCIPVKAKKQAVVMIVLLFSVSLYFIRHYWYFMVLHVAIAFCLTGFILSRPSRH